MRKMHRKTLKERGLPPWLTRPAFIVGAIIVILFVIISVFPAEIAPYDPVELDIRNRMVPPGTDGHLFGTDNYGRDVFSRVIWGARYDLAMGLLGALIPLITGGLLGLITGYYGGMLDSIVMRVVDILMSFPFTVLVIVIMTILGPGLHNVFIALWMVGWMDYTRLVRGEVMVLKEAEFIQAAQIAGFSDKRVLLRHLLPNVISSSVVFAASDVVLCMILGASMSFLGLGVQLPTPEWGAILNEGRGYLSFAWWITFFPGLFMAITGVGFSLLGDGLTDYLRTKGR